LKALLLKALLSKALLKALHGRSACRGDALTLRSAGGLTHFDRGPPV